MGPATSSDIVAKARVLEMVEVEVVYGIFVCAVRPRTMMSERLAATSRQNELRPDWAERTMALGSS